jgi:catechol 2,3-dioxygenase-like lactoylglutathione lyase family enzyme
MSLNALDHVFVRAADLEQSRRFYVEALGLEELPRPPIPFPGYWLGVNGQVQIHMGPASIPGQAQFYASDPARALDGHSGVIDHVAFRASDPRGVRARLERCGVPYRPRAYPEARIWQILVEDPNGVTIELNFVGIDPAEWDAG